MSDAEDSTAKESTMHKGEDIARAIEEWFQKTGNSPNLRPHVEELKKMFHSDE